MTRVGPVAVLACVLAGCGGALGGETPAEPEVIRPAESARVDAQPSPEPRVALQRSVVETHAHSPDPPPPIRVPEGTSERGAFSFEPNENWYTFQKEMERDVGFSFPHEAPPKGTRMLEKIDDGVW